MLKPSSDGSGKTHQARHLQYCNFIRLRLVAAQE
jgi:hypothetical protein